MPRMKGKQAVMEMLKAEGVTTVFGNPGTTETPLIDALQDHPEVRYILALQEASAVGMADGYARATGRPAFCNVHITVGVANAMSLLHNAYKGGTPLVLTAGQSDTHLLIQEPLIGSDQARHVPFAKWSAEVLHARELPMALRRAFRVAGTPPTGPVFLSLPWNVLDEEDEVEIAPSSPIYPRVRPDAEAVEKAAALLARARHPLLLLGDRVAQAGAVEEAVEVAELLGARVYASAYSEVNFPNAHPQSLGGLTASWASRSLQEALAPVDVLLVVGADILTMFAYTAQRLLGPKTRIVHLDSQPRDIEKRYATEVGMVGDPKAGLGDLASALRQAMDGEAREEAKSRREAIGREKARRQAAFQQRARETGGSPRISPERMMVELATVLPADAIVVSEAITSTGALLAAMEFRRPGDYYAGRGGSLGWGIPGALGVKLARPDRPVVAVVADGTSMYSIQGLWTAARYNIPVKYVICNNGGYRILKQGMAMYLTGTGRESQYVGMGFDPLPLNLARIAEAFNVPGTRVERREELRPAYEKLLSASGPALVDVVIDGTVPVQALQEGYRPFAPER
ncbi:MAG: thiamine pyrophosphate-binding protein [Chloroflexi bacterium]|nr:thiamine pyrophosphate-binding protein [Chloroflexota bacterium]